MNKPYADDWGPTANPDIEYSPQRQLYWSAKEQKCRDQRSAEWAGWIGLGFQLKKQCRFIRENQHDS